MASSLERSRRVYQALDLPDHSPLDVVKRAFKELALRYHPDKNLADPTATERFQEIHAAYTVLSNAERKAAYDSTLRSYDLFSSSSASPSAATRSFTGASSSTLYDELSSFRAARRASSNSRAAPAKEPKESQYTAEQTEFFRMRAKERERELYRRMEREKEEARQRELDKFKQAQEDRLREDERRRREQMPASAAGVPPQVVPVSPLSGRVGTKPPADAPPGLGKPPGGPAASTGSAKEQRGPRCRSVSPSPVTTISANDEGSMARHRERVERIRKEKERQEEIRRAEQERFFDKKLQEARAKEERRSRLADVEVKEHFSREQQSLFAQEAAERQQLLEAEELMERRWLASGLRKAEHAHGFKVRLEHLTADMMDARDRLIERWAKTASVLQLLMHEGVGRVAIAASYRSAHEKILLIDQLEKQRARRNAVERMRLLQSAELSAEERIFALQRRDFAAIVVQFDEGRHRGSLQHREAHERAVFQRRSVDSAQGILTHSELLASRGRIAAMELFERAALGVWYVEGTERALLTEDEDRAVMHIIRLRGRQMVCLVSRAALEQSASLDGSRRREQLDLSRMALEIERLHDELHSARNEIELLRAASAAAAASRSDGSSSPIVASKQSSGGSGELIAMLCDENRRLAASNAALLTEMRSVGGAASSRNGGGTTVMPSASSSSQAVVGLCALSVSAQPPPVSAPASGKFSSGMMLSPAPDRLEKVDARRGASSQAAEMPTPPLGAGVSSASASPPNRTRAWGSSRHGV
jgi:curved DNA-binding protein CbpA